MEKFHQADQIEGNQTNIAHILSEYSISEFVFSPISQGLENSSFRIDSKGKKYVLRIYRYNKKREADILLELRFQDFLREKAIPVPVIYSTSKGSELATVTIEGKEWHAILMQFIEGSSEVNDYSKQLSVELAAYQSKMHLLGVEFAESVPTQQKHTWLDLHDSIADDIVDISNYDSETQGFIRRVKAFRYPLNQGLPHGYNHLDLYLDGNIITKNDHIAAVLDFDDLQYSPIVVCLGFTLWEILLMNGEEKVHQYLVEYTKTRELTELEYHTLPHVMLFRNYVIGIVEVHVLQRREYFDKILQFEKDIPQMTFGPST